MKINKYLIIVFIFCIQPVLHAQQGIVPLEEMVALKTFYLNHVINPDKDLRLSGWDMAQPNTNPDVSGWEGITVENGHVIRIELSGKGLEGDFSTRGDSWLLSLPYLKHLDISNNGFDGWFPLLNTTYGSVSGEIEYFNISNNDFTGFLYFPNHCVKLKEFRISNNRFQNFSVSPSLLLDTIDASRNMLIGNFFPYSIPDSVESTSLKFVDIRYNKYNFASLWMYSDPYGAPWTQIVGSDENGPILDTLWYDKCFYLDPQVTFLYDSQDSVYMRNTVRNLRLRKTPGASFRIDLPDVGQQSTRFPDLRDSLVYQWYKNGLPLAADTFAYLERTSVGLTDYGRYYCEIKTRTGTGRLQDLTLSTESFVVVNEVNQPPVINILDDIEQPRRVLKGRISDIIHIEVLDDEVNGVERLYVSQPPKHVEVVLPGLTRLRVQDTTLMWTGLDSLQLSACDFDGLCDTSQWIYFEVYDLLYTAPLVSVSSPDSGKISIKLDTAFYASKAEKPSEYYLLLWVDEQSMGGNYVKADSVFFTGTSGNFLVDLPPIGKDYFINVEVYPQNSEQTGQDPMGIMFIMPTKPDSLFDAVGNAASIHLQWESKGSEISVAMSSNILYRSVDNAGFVLLAEVPPGITSYEDTDVEEGHLYQYRLAKKIYGFYDSQQGSAIEFPWLYSSTQFDLRTAAGNMLGVSDSHIFNAVYYEAATQNVVIKTSRNDISSVEIFNTAGSVVAKYDKPEVLNNAVRLNLSSLGTGAYHIRVKSRSGYSGSASIIKE